MLEKFKKWKLRRKARLKLISQYEYMNEVDTLLEEDATAKILVGGSSQFIEQGRKNLIEIQKRLAANKAFVEFLKKVK